jgi:hypothetical protein
MNSYDWNNLSEFTTKRRRFDPSNPKDLKELSFFKKNGKWKDGCPFFIEWPFKDVVTMCQERYTTHMLGRLKK